MASYNTPIITTQGQSLLKATIANNDTMTFTKIVFSSDDYSQSTDSNVASLSALSSLDLTATARAFVDVNGNLKIRGVANNQNTTSAFYIKTYGLYVKNSAGTEMLFAVATTQNANFVPAYNNKQTNQVAYTFNLAISSTNNITLSNQSDVDVTQADIASINSAVNSNASSLSSSMSSISNSLSSSIANNLSEITNLNMNALQYYGVVPTNTLANISKDGMYNLAGRQYTDGPYQGLIWGTIIQFGTQAAVQSQIILTNFGTMYFRAINSWGIEGWFAVAKGSDVTALQNSLSANISSNSSSISSLSSSAGSAISSNSANIASNASAISSNASAIFSNANSTSSAISSVSSSNNAVSSSIASTVSVNQSNIANNSSAINSLVSSASSAIANNTANITGNSSAIASVASSASSTIANVQQSVANNSSAVTNISTIALQFRGDANISALSELWQTGYYNLAGNKFPDSPYGSGVALYGQIVVMDTGGVTTQQIYSNGGGICSRAINSWGITPWKIY
ncbi:hypothetical protein AKUH3B102A_PHAGE100570 (plasmid) [Apilactobacillus kunkeei]|nr:hypothetical protein AKUH3B102A_PHAGE100570 [Apilactobacillus kunkeei]CAI2700313.1 hypothetical protein AKUH3B107A_PHAGE100570 [Apilactobacillus kunkeei]